MNRKQNHPSLPEAKHTEAILTRKQTTKGEWSPETSQPKTNDISPCASGLKGGAFANLNAQQLTKKTKRVTRKRISPHAPHQ